MFKPLLLSSLLATASAATAAEPFSFVLLGDAPYGAPEAVYAPFRTMIDTINAQDPTLVVHVGDTKSGSTPCSDQMLDDQLDFLNSFAAPTLYSPGDNEWTDCHRAKAGGFDPLERLDYIRNTYYVDPATSFGQAPVEVTHQGDAGYPENTRLLLNDVMFITTHVVGSNNNFEIRDPSAVAEFMARDAANLDWLKASFAAADNAAAIVLAIHADMFEFGFGTSSNPEAFVRHSGFQNFGSELVRLANGFGKPVLLVFGDSHTFRMFRPFPKTSPHVMALETFGSKDMHAVEVTVTPEDAFPFAIQPLLNPAVPITAPQM
ncbi:hypothetical protein AB0T83_02345 [Fluviibacterium sp. DFM31]|uniref:Calcineurin-like phosphoesterase domain-containing protein n=1 Tax=Meridianimarinicoccus marinus TaxID=3231483 RepID=A0ABV3L253_9RHOB